MTPHLPVAPTGFCVHACVSEQVRYIGAVASAKDQAAVYLGVEWDDVTRGKHDGCDGRDISGYL